MLGNPGFGSGPEMGGLFESQQMEQSFKEFLNRPENRPKVEAYQRKELVKNIKATEKKRAVDFRDTVLASEFDSQKAIQPFLKYRVLRKVVQTLTNDPEKDFDYWASNPRVIKLLQDAKTMLDEGRMTEDEMEYKMLAQFTNEKHEAHEEFKGKTEFVARLQTEQLVGALNEHLQERNTGNEHFRAKDYRKALHHYERALSILKIVRGMGTADQIEILRNKQAVLRNIAAVHLETEYYGAAIDFCTQAIAVGGGEDIKGLIRRAKAYMGRHEYEAAQADLEKVKELEPWNFEAQTQIDRLARLRANEHSKEKSGFVGMFSG